MLILDFNFGTGSVFFVDFDEKILLERGGWIVEQIISDALCFKSMVILFVGIKFQFIMEVVLKLRTVAGDLECEMSILLRLLYFVELLERDFLNS